MWTNLTTAFCKKSVNAYETPNNAALYQDFPLTCQDTLQLTIFVFVAPFWDLQLTVIMN